MPFPTSESTADESAKQALHYARALRAFAVRLIAQCDAGSLDLHEVCYGFLGATCNALKLKLDALAGVPGIFDALLRAKPGVFASAAEAETALTDARNAIDAMIASLEATIPVDGSRHVLVSILSNDGSGRVSRRTITNPAQLAAFKSELQTFRDGFSG
jgi:hypothetical protein